MPVRRHDPEGVPCTRDQAASVQHGPRVRLSAPMALAPTLTITSASRNRITSAVPYHTDQSHRRSGTGVGALKRLDNVC